MPMMVVVLVMRAVVVVRGWDDHTSRQAREQGSGRDDFKDATHGNSIRDTGNSNNAAGGLLHYRAL
jgi:hypothetical protein